MKKNERYDILQGTCKPLRTKLILPFPKQP